MTRSTLLPLAATALATLFTVPAFAQDGPKAVTRVEALARLDGDFVALDSDKDGKVTKAEMAAHLAAKAKAELAALEKRRDDSFTKIDSDKNGSISKAEFVAATKLEIGQTGDGTKLIARYDANKDGAFTKEEYRAPSLANFDRMDANRDGTLSVAEQTPRKTTTVGR